MKKIVLKSAYILLFYSAIAAADFKQGGIDYKNGDFESAIGHFKEAAEKNDHRAMYALGSMYAGGQGIQQDYKQAYVWFRKADKFGRTDAQYKLGLMYEQGLGLKINPKKAVKWYSKAANGGYPPAWYKLGMMYAQGMGVKQNNTKAYAWLNAALSVFKQGQAQSEKNVTTAEGQEDPIMEMETTLTEIGPALTVKEREEAKVLLTKIQKTKR